MLKFKQLTAHFHCHSGHKQRSPSVVIFIILITNSENCNLNFFFNLFIILFEDEHDYCWTTWIPLEAELQRVFPFFPLVDGRGNRLNSCEMIKQLIYAFVRLYSMNSVNQRTAQIKMLTWCPQVTLETVWDWLCVQSDFDWGAREKGYHVVSYSVMIQLLWIIIIHRNWFNVVFEI